MPPSPPSAWLVQASVPSGVRLPSEVWISYWVMGPQYPAFRKNICTRSTQKKVPKSKKKKRRAGVRTVVPTVVSYRPSTKLVTTVVSISIFCATPRRAANPKAMFSPIVRTSIAARRGRSRRK